MTSRRDFLVTIGAAAFSATHLALPRRREVTVMGLGGAGMAVIRQLQRERFDAEFWSWDAVEHGDAYVDHSSVVSYALLRHPRANIMVPKAIADRLNGVRTPLLNSSVVIVVGLGGEAGSLLMPPLARLLEGRCRRLALAASLPIRAIHGRPATGRVRWALSESQGAEMRTLLLSPLGRYRDGVATGRSSIEAAQRTQRWSQRTLASMVRHMVALGADTRVNWLTPTQPENRFFG